MNFVSEIWNSIRLSNFYSKFVDFVKALPVFVQFVLEKEACECLYVRARDRNGCIKKWFKTYWSCAANRAIECDFQLIGRLVIDYALIYDVVIVYSLDCCFWFTIIIFILLFSLEIFIMFINQPFFQFVDVIIFCFQLYHVLLFQFSLLSAQVIFLFFQLMFLIDKVNLSIVIFSLKVSHFLI